MLDIFPPEILHHIFTYACTDSGSTARALSVTSKYLADSAAPFLYRTLSLSGITDIQHALRCLSALPEPHRRVEHLMLAD
ncbi:hypothetical protein FA95DRAFT_1503723, partial [Auriscalpium vulgare]